MDYESGEDHSNATKKSEINVSESSPKKGPSKDVTERRSIFISNLSFDATEDDIKNLLSEFGEVKYVLLCIDKLTEHPKGTAFAQFLKKECAEECLNAANDSSQQEKFVINGRTMRISLAISRDDLNKKKQNNATENKGKDKRNLYLAREGHIKDGSEAASGVSKYDMELRKRIAQNNRMLLKNFHIFISPTRLCIHNIPLNMSDKKLRKIILNNTPKEAKVTEVRIMRDFKNLDENGIGASKGFGFVSLSTHEHALAALRKINNNPAVFSKKNRPIDEFSLENKSALRAKEKRLMKSKENNKSNFF